MEGAADAAAATRPQAAADAAGGASKKPKRQSRGAGPLQGALKKKSGGGRSARRRRKQLAGTVGQPSEQQLAHPPKGTWAARPRVTPRPAEAASADGGGGGGAAAPPVVPLTAGERAGEAERLGCTVFVSGLPYTATVQEVAMFFASCGAVVETRIPKCDENGLAMGYAHVEFESAAVAARAIELNGQNMGRRYLDISAAREARGGVGAARTSQVRRDEKSSTLFVRNIPFDANEGLLARHFGASATEVRLPMDQHTGRCKGYGYVEFPDEDSAEAALNKFEGKPMLGRQLFLDYDSGLSADRVWEPSTAGGEEYS